MPAEGVVETENVLESAQNRATEIAISPIRTDRSTPPHTDRHPKA